MQSGSLEESSVNMVREVLYAPKLHLIGGHVRSVNDSSMPNDNQQISMDGEDDDKELINGVSRFEDADEKLLRRLPRDTESAAIMVANVGALQRPLSAFVRLKKAASCKKWGFLMIINFCCFSIPRTTRSTISSQICICSFEHL